MTQEKKALSETADAILQNSVTVTVDTPARTWWERLLVRVGLRKEQRVFHVKPLVLGSLIRVSKLLLSIDNSQFTSERINRRSEFLNLGYGLAEQHGQHMARIVAIAVTNEQKEPSDSLVNFFLHHLTATELQRVFGIVMQQMEIQNFIVSIISARGLNVLEEKDANAPNAGMNPATKGSEIASSNLSAA